MHLGSPLSTMDANTASKVTGLFSFFHSRKKALYHLQRAFFAVLIILVVFEFVVLTVFLFSDEQSRMKRDLDIIEKNLLRINSTEKERISIEIARHLAPDLIWELSFSYIKTLRESIATRFYLHLAVLLASCIILIINITQTTRSMLSNSINICLILILSYIFLLNAATAKKYMDNMRLKHRGGIISYYFSDKYQSFYNLSGIPSTDNLEIHQRPILNSMLISIFQLIMCYTIVIIYILQMLLVQLKLDRERNNFENPLVQKGGSLDQKSFNSEASSEYSHLSMANPSDDDNQIDFNGHRTLSHGHSDTLKNMKKQRISKLQYPGDNLGAGEADVYAICPDYENVDDDDLKYITLEKIDEMGGDLNYLKEEKVEPGVVDTQSYDKQFERGKEAYQDKLMRMDEIMNQKYHNPDDQ